MSRKGACRFPFLSSSRLSSLLASLLLISLITVITCISLLLPTYSKGKLSTRLLISLACRAASSPQACESSLILTPLALHDSPARLVTISIALAQQRTQVCHAQSQALLPVASSDPNLVSAAHNCEYLLRRASYVLQKGCTLCDGSSNNIAFAGAVGFDKIKDMEAWMSAALTWENDCYSALGYVNGTHSRDMSFHSHSGDDLTQSSADGSKNTAFFLNQSEMQHFELLSHGAIDTLNVTAQFGSSHADEAIHYLMQCVQIAINFTSNALSMLDAYDTHGANVSAWSPPSKRTLPGYQAFRKRWIMPQRCQVKGKTIITGNLNAQMPGVSTYDTATVAVDGDEFIACYITIENLAQPDRHQAVALRVGSDRSAFYHCSFLGHQDTLYAHSLRQYYQSCRIEGTIDFIFGNAASVFQNCEVLIRPGCISWSAITAHGRTDPAQTTGFVFEDCIINGTNEFMESFILNPKKYKVYLGRPWKPFSRTIYKSSWIERVVRPEGWRPWRGDFALSTLFYGEYNNMGIGAGFEGRVKWAEQISSSMAMLYTVSNFIQGDEWLLDFVTK
ncbi:hypothetical protein GOP47_0000630 [Adiantum capillus-veneris]|uniref:Pectinesterase n=1 Tax=Adiantum capillus-veneris TaxID=13818 RepID=A0A9D4ZSH3_ADICA|nr:hypothetical protein GOP47_0000630 [Adiantum capillus-veneris]